MRFFIKNFNTQSHSKQTLSQAFIQAIYETLVLLRVKFLFSILKGFCFLFFVFCFFFFFFNCDISFGLHLIRVIYHSFFKGIEIHMWWPKNHLGRPIKFSSHNNKTWSNLSASLGWIALIKN